MKSVKPPEKTQLNINAATLPTATCSQCGNFTFESAFIIKKLSKLVSPSGKDTIVPIQVFTCASCGAVLPLGGEDSVHELIADLIEPDPNTNMSAEPESNASETPQAEQKSNLIILPGSGAVN